MDVAHLMAAAVLFDIDGVLVLSWRAIPGAAETVRQLTHRGIACAYLTNMDPALVAAGDSGVPLVLSSPDSAIGKELHSIADGLSTRRRGLAGMSLGLDPTRR